MRAAVLQAPGEDAPRLRLADELAARGDPRGEFIRVQIQLARGETSEEATADRLAQRECELLARHEAEWVGPFATYLIGWTFRRGFIEDVILDGKTFLARAEEIFRALPVAYLGVLDVGAVIDEFAASPYLRQIRRLHFGLDDGDSEPLGDGGAAVLARSPHLSGLERLTLGMEQINGDGLVALAEAPWLRSLRNLGLAQNEVGDDALQSFFATAPLEKMEVLNLDWAGAGDESITALARTPLAELRVLDLQSNDVGEAGLAALAASTLQPRLGVLDLCGVGLDSVSLKPLYGSPLLNRLSKLRIIANNELTTADLSRFLASSSFPKLKELGLGSVKFGDEGAKIVAQTAALGQLTHLSFPGSMLTGKGVKSLADSPHLARLEGLDLFSNGGTSVAAQAIAASSTLTGLQKLVLSNNEITDEGVLALAKSSNLGRLRSLTLRANSITIKGIKALAESPVLGRLRSLDLGYLSLGDDAAAMLASSKPLSNLTSLLLVSNKITLVGARALASSTGLANVVELDLRRNPVDDVALEVLRSTFGHRVRLGGPVFQIHE
jgi:uncharacterized protein (TIGR02996 family)